MKIATLAKAGATAAIAMLLWTGCAHPNPNYPGVTNANHPGPAIGRDVGAGIGAVGGNIAGGVVGFGEGVSAGVRSPFFKTAYVVRTWHREQTSDGRVILVPRDIEVDQYGRELNPIIGKKKVAN
jgi:hypothetical protein